MSLLFDAALNQSMVALTDATSHQSINDIIVHNLMLLLYILLSHTFYICYPDAAFHDHYHWLLIFIYAMSTDSLATVQNACANTFCVNLELHVLLVILQKDNF